MNIEDKREQRLEALIVKASQGDRRVIESLKDLLTWGLYSPSVFSQFGYGLSGFVYRQSAGGVRSTVKVVESGVPLVAFVSSATTAGNVEQMFDLLFEGRLKWQKDKYPWI